MSLLVKAPNKLVYLTSDLGQEGTNDDFFDVPRGFNGMTIKVPGPISVQVPNGDSSISSVERALGHTSDASKMGIYLSSKDLTLCPLLNLQVLLLK